MSPFRTTLVTAGAVEGLSSVMADAFGDDPVLNWLFEPAVDVAAARRRFFSLALSAGRQRGHTYRCGTDSEAMAGAIWLPPDVHGLFVDTAPMGAFIGGEIGGDAPERLSALGELMAANHPEDSAFHLLLLGVAPAAQGRGIGRLAMNPVLERCDHDRIPIYLESSNPRNIAFYGRMGFEVISDFGPTEQVRLAGMWREPRG